MLGARSLPLALPLLPTCAGQHATSHAREAVQPSVHPRAARWRCREACSTLALALTLARHGVWFAHALPRGFAMAMHTCRHGPRISRKHSHMYLWCGGNTAGARQEGDVVRRTTWPGGRRGQEDSRGRENQGVRRTKVSGGPRCQGSGSERQQLAAAGVVTGDQHGGMRGREQKRGAVSSRKRGSIAWAQPGDALCCDGATPQRAVVVDFPASAACATATARARISTTVATAINAAGRLCRGGNAPRCGRAPTVGIGVLPGRLADTKYIRVPRAGADGGHVGGGCIGPAGNERRCPELPWTD